MGTNTTKLGLLKPSENDFYNQQTEQADNWEKVDKFADDIQKNVDFNLLATLGIEYGGILNNTNAKVAGKAYYDTTGKKLYKCIINTSINYADAGFFEAISNNDLLNEIKNIQKNKWVHQFSIFGSDTGRYEGRKKIAIPDYYNKILVRGSYNITEPSRDGTQFELRALSPAQTIPSGTELTLNYDWHDYNLGFHYFFVAGYEDPLAADDTIELFASV